MKLYKFEKAYQSHKIRLLLEEYNIPNHHIDDILGRLDYRLYFYDDDKRGSQLSVLERLSVIPLHIVLLIMAVIVMPIKWIFTGKYRFEFQKPSWLWAWITKFY